MPLDPDFFTRCDALKHEISSLQGVESSLASAQSALAREKSSLVSARTALKRNRHCHKEQIDRIELVGTHWFYGNTVFQPQLWFRGGTQGKIDRAHAKLKQCEAERPGIEVFIEQLETQSLPPLVAEVDELTKRCAYKESLDMKYKKMREAAVAANPSPALTSFQAQADSLTRQIASRHQICTGLSQVGDVCQEAQIHYQWARQHAEKAQKLHAQVQSERSNHQQRQREEKVQKQQCCGPNGCHCCEECARSSSHEHGPRCDHQYVETSERHLFEEAQDRRERIQSLRKDCDRQLQEAQKEIDKGAQLLYRAFASVPQAVRDEYPDLCYPLINANVPILGQNQGMNVEEKIEAIIRCDSLAFEKVGHVRALEDQLHQDIKPAQLKLKNIEASIETEKDRILTDLRSTMTSETRPSSFSPSYRPPSATELLSDMLVSAPADPEASLSPTCPVAVAYPIKD